MDVKHLDIVTQHPIHHLPKDAFVYCLKADPIDAPLFVGFENPAASFLFNKFFGQKEPFSDKRLQMGALGFIVLKMLKSLDEIKLFPRLGIHMQEYVQSKETLHHVTFALELGEENFIHLHLYYDESFIRSFNALHESLESEETNPILYDVKLVIGSTQLDKSQIDQLKKDHVLMLENAHLNLETKKGVVTFEVFNQPVAEARISSNHLKIIDLVTPSFGETMEDTMESNLKNMDEIKLNIKVELASLKLPLHKLKNLKSGDTLDFEMENIASVFLTLEGQKIAKGELIKLGDNIGVLIQETAYDR
jgi:flagellar motor switch/type III secretory pathway protein FliN